MFLRLHGCLTSNESYLMGMCLSVQHGPKAETHDNLNNPIKTKMVIQQTN